MEAITTIVERITATESVLKEMVEQDKALAAQIGELNKKRSALRDNHLANTGSLMQLKDVLKNVDPAKFAELYPEEAKPSEPAPESMKAALEKLPAEEPKKK